MRIAIITIGSRGDVQPYIALGQGLIKAGHTVRLVTHKNFEAFVKSYGLEFWPIRGNSQEIMGSHEMRELSEKKANIVATVRHMQKSAERAINEWMEDGLVACQGMDLLIANSVGLTIGSSLAEKYHLPLLQTYLFPITPTRAFPSMLIPPNLTNLGGAFNLISSHLILQLTWLGARPILNRARKKVLDLPPASFVASQAPGSNGLPVLYGFSPSVIPAPADWGADDHVTGYWFLDPAADWTPPPDLLNFLQAGSPPVYIGFGSMGSRDPAETTDLVLQALAKTQQRAILLSGWGGMQKTELPDFVFMIDSIPHAWLFSHVAAVVHHGGAGTTAAGLRAGVPSILIPFLGDQPFWGQRVHDLGVGPAPIPRSKLTVDRLAQAIQAAVTNTAMRQRAAELGSKIQAEDGIANAVEIIQRIEGIKS